METSTQQCLGYNLRVLRASKNVNQNELAEFIGLTRSSYAQYELGNRTPDAQTLRSIAQFYSVSMELLFEPNLKRFLSELTYSQLSGDNSQMLLDNFNRLSPFSKGRLVEYSEKLLEWDKIREQNLAELEKRRQMK